MKSCLQESRLRTEEKRRLSRTARVYDAARVAWLSAGEVNRLSETAWKSFVNEVKACNGLERRRILHLAYERWHQREILRGLAEPSPISGPVRNRNRPPSRKSSSASMSARNPCAARSKSWIPQVETFSAAGYFGDGRGLPGHRRLPRRRLLPRGGEAAARRPRTTEAEDSALLESRRWRRRLLGLLMQQFVRVIKDAAARLALHHRAGPALRDPSHRPSARAQPLRPLARWMNKAFLPEPRTELTFMRNAATRRRASRVC